MALFMKQDFTPPILSRKWIAIRFRQNMLLYSRHHIISILESGLLFREDSAEVEQECPSAEDVWAAAGGGRHGWLTGGEAAVAAVAIAAAVIAFPPKSFSRSVMLNMAAYTTLPVALRASHRALCRGSLASLLANMREYLALARRTAACLKEYAALHAQLGSLSSVIESTHMMLCRQQSELALVMARASSSLLGNAPWLRADVAWDAVVRDRTDNLMKIHHAFLVVQSTLLKHIAMAHYIPSPKTQKLYKNHNERIYWIHTAIIDHLNEEFRQNYESLERMYRLLKNSASRNVDVSKKLGTAVNDSWVYSDVHTGIARACLELKLALNKSNGLDMLLDSCALNKQQLDLNVLNKDIDDLIDNLTKCLTTVQNSQLRLKKLYAKEKKPDATDQGDVDVVENSTVLKIEDKEPETRDEVFYFVKTDDDNAPTQPSGDLTTAPGKKERETTKVVLTELKRKLGKREDVMRERERQALAKTMPEYKNNLPEFPRQIELDEFVDKKGYIQKISKRKQKKKLFKNYKISSKSNSKKNKIKKYKFQMGKFERKNEITEIIYEANAYLNCKSKLLTISPNVITKWCKFSLLKKKEFDSSGMSEDLSDVEAGTANKTINQAVNSQDKIIKFTKRDLELSNSSSESNFEYNTEEQQALLNDIRRHRLVRKRNQPRHKATTSNVDESLRPIEYSFGTGLAMASVLQINNKAKIPHMAQEEVFIGDGEVSGDSGNDEDSFR